jgi:hypothetical protein
MMMYEVVLIDESNDVQYLEVWQARGEMPEELIKRSFGADASTMKIVTVSVERASRVRANTLKARYVLGKQGEMSCTGRVATTWPAVVTLTDDARGTLRWVGEQARLPRRGCGSTCTKRKL